MSDILSGLRILDLSRVFSGPFTTQMLADFGADVIKIERPGSGDESRQQGFRMKNKDGEEIDYTSAFLSMNRGKRSVTVDLATPRGQEIVRALALKSDVFIENFKAGDLKRYGLDYETLHVLNPRLIYCSITGFGQTGPRSHLPGYDLVFQAMSGVMAITGIPEGEPGAGPQRVGYSVSDITAAYHATIAILGALFARATGTASGQYIDISLLDTQIAAASHMAMNYLVTGQLPKPIGAGSHMMVPYQPFECSDFTLIVLCGNDGQFKRLMSALGLPEYAQDPRFSNNFSRLEHRNLLVPVIADILRQRPREHWVKMLEAANVPCAPLYDFSQALADPQVVHRGMLMTLPHAPSGTDLPLIANPLNFSETPVRYRNAPPSLGEHTHEVLKELLDISDEELAVLHQDQVI